MIQAGVSVQQAGPAAVGTIAAELVDQNVV